MFNVLNYNQAYGKGGKENDGTHHKKPSNQGHCNRHFGTRLSQRSSFVAQTNLRTQT